MVTSDIVVVAVIVTSDIVVVAVMVTSEIVVVVVMADFGRSCSRSQVTLDIVVVAVR